MTNFEMAMKNYTRGLWTDDMLSRLVEKGRLSAEEYEKITGVPCPAEADPPLGKRT